MDTDHAILWLRNVLTSRQQVAAFFPLLAFATIVFLLRLYDPRILERRITAFITFGFASLVVVTSTLDFVPYLGVGGYAFTIAVVLCLYAAIVSCLWLVTKFLGRAQGSISIIPVLLPVVVLIVLKLIPLSSIFSVRLEMHGVTMAAVFTGLSYVSFRLSLLAMEVRNSLIPCPTLRAYCTYAFFVPTLSVGPISPYREFADCARELRFSKLQSLQRIVVGLTKYLVFSSILGQFTYAGLILDGHSHSPIDLIISAVAYYFFLYCNFSGYCDMAVGFSGLLGVRVRENFNSPFLARNIKDFWNRWHITLSEFMRDLIFTPLCQALARRWGASSVRHAIPISAMTVFILIGLWHGFEWHFLVMGVMHGVGVVVNHYYSGWLKQRLSREGLGRYNRSLLIRVFSISTTFTYVTASLFFFANDATAIRAIWKAVIW